MKSDLDFNFNVNYKKGNEKKEIGFFSLLLEFFKSVLKVAFFFLLLSPFFIGFFSYYNCYHNEKDKILKFSELWKQIVEYFKLIYYFVCHPLSNLESENKININVFFPAIIFSLFFAGSISSNVSFSSGFSSGVEKALRFINLKKKDEILERDFIEDKLIKILEDIQNKSVKLQYDFFEFSKKNEKLNNSFNYGEVEKPSNSTIEVEQMKKKVDSLETTLEKLSGNIFDLGMSMSRNNNGYYWRLPKRRLNYNKNSEIENKEEKNSEEQQS